LPDLEFHVHNAGERLACNNLNRFKAETVQLIVVGTRLQERALRHTSDIHTSLYAPRNIRQHAHSVDSVITQQSNSDYIITATFPLHHIYCC